MPGVKAFGEVAGNSVCGLLKTGGVLLFRKIVLDD
jgi:hypothetical protein